jgi:hypothetical protein
MDSELVQCGWEKPDRQCAYNVTMRRVRVTIVAVGKAISITYSECVFLYIHGSVHRSMTQEK